MVDVYCLRTPCFLNSSQFWPAGTRCFFTFFLLYTIKMRNRLNPLTQHSDSEDTCNNFLAKLWTCIVPAHTSRPPPFKTRCEIGMLSTGGVKSSASPEQTEQPLHLPSPFMPLRLLLLLLLSLSNTSRQIDRGEKEMNEGEAERTKRGGGRTGEGEKGKWVSSVKRNGRLGGEERRGGRGWRGEGCLSASGHPAALNVSWTWEMPEPWRRLHFEEQQPGSWLSREKKTRLTKSLL